jgi:D-arabinitol 4-dehydrogenase
MQATGDLDWGIAAVNLRKSESGAFAKNKVDNSGYLLKTTAPDGTQDLRLVRSHLSFTDWATHAEDAELLLSRLSVHAVTITVTESGYYLKSDMTLNEADDVIKAEMRGGPPQSIYAFLSLALSRRAGAHGNPLTIMCCNNIRANGEMLKRNLLKYLALQGDEELAKWVRASVKFPNSMVDRITPRVSSETGRSFGV